MSPRRTLIGLTIGLAALCLCAFAVALLAVAGLLLYRSVSEALTPTAAPPATRPATDTPGPAPTPNPEALAEMEDIQRWVIQQRGLQPAGRVERKFLSEGQVLERTRQEFEKDTSPEEVRDDVRALAVLGLVEPGLDLYSLLVRLHSEGIAGFYDPDTRELVVVSAQGQLNAYERSTFAHEYNHALQDQAYGIRAMGYSDEGYDSDPEKAEAVQALLEGDATLLEEQYQATFTPSEKQEYEQSIADVDASVYQALPDYLLRDFVFPYTYGLDFVRRYYGLGGWARVDEVWRNPPVSSEQIIHPERYDSGDNPIPVPRPALTNTLGAGWRQIESSVLGEWYTYLILAYGVDPDARLARSDASRAAEGWGGDSFLAFYHEAQSQTVVALHWQWDTADEAEEFTRAFRRYADERLGAAVDTSSDHVCWDGSERHCLYFNGAHTLWLAAPDQATLEKVLAEYPDLKGSDQ
jgi:hypothetical protein